GRAGREHQDHPGAGRELRLRLQPHRGGLRRGPGLPHRGGREAVLVRLGGGLSMNADLLETYRQRNCVRHFDAITTVSDHWVRQAVAAVNGEMDGRFSDLVSSYQGAGTSDLAKDLGVSYEFA